MNNTHVLNLDREFHPLAFSVKETYDIPFELKTFPGGEPHFRITDEIDDAENTQLVITQRFNTVADLMLILVATDAARRIGFREIDLILPYFPAARQDRVCNPGEALTIKVFADLINNCHFANVYIYSPHSEVTPALIDRCKLLELDERFLDDIIIMNDYGKRCDEINIVCPDAGAGKRVSKLAKHVANRFPNLKVNLIRCEKVRDVSTGELKEFFVQADHLGYHPTIICDDIVAYGGTFKGLGVEQRKKNCGDLSLFTSHADCTEGLQNMVDFFDFVYTSNSKRNWKLDGTNANKLHTFPILL